MIAAFFTSYKTLRFASDDVPQHWGIPYVNKAGIYSVSCHWRKDGTAFNSLLTGGDLIFQIKLYTWV